MKKIRCGTINPNILKIPGKPNRAMTPEVKSASIWIDRKNDYRRHKEKQKLRQHSDEYGNGGVFICSKQPAYFCGGFLTITIILVFNFMSGEFK